MARKSHGGSVAATVRPRTGGQRCVVCHHQRRVEFDRALATETMKPADVAREVVCSRQAVHRHIKNHLLPALRASATVATADVDLVGECKILYAKMREHLARVEGENNWKALRAFHAEARADLELLARLVGKLEAPTVNVTVSPVWIQVRGVIVEALKPFPDAGAAVARALLGVGHG